VYLQLLPVTCTYNLPFYFENVTILIQETFKGCVYLRKVYATKKKSVGFDIIQNLYVFSELFQG